VRICSSRAASSIFRAFAVRHVEDVEDPLVHRVDLRQMDVDAEVVEDSW
jgi:hypothetical protein